MRSDDATTREVQRYAPEGHPCECGMQECDWGEYVKFEDAEARIATLAAEVERVKGAVRWALGEGDSDFGASLGDRAPGDGKLPRIGRYWWRAELRKRAGLDAPRGEM